MKKNLKRLIAIVAAVAMTVTGITFTPSKVDAAQANSCVIGSETTVGQWIYTVVQNQWNNEAASYNDASKVDGFIYSHDVYGWDGAYWKVRDLKSVYGLTAGTSYAMTINVKAPSNYTTSQTTTLNIRTTGGTADMAPTSKTLSPGAELTYTADVTPGTANFVLAIGYGNNGQGGAAGAQVGGFEIESITFTPKETTTNLYDWQRCPFDDTPFVPEAGSPWTLRSNNNASTAWGNQYYKMDSSKAVGNISRMHLKKDYVDGTNSNDWWWDSASLMGYGTTLGLDNGSAYTGKIVINTDTATSGSHTIRIVAFGHQYDVPLTAGDNEITINKFKYNPADNDNIQFDYVEMPQNAEFYIKSIVFNSIYDGWTKAPFAIDSAISNSNWSTSVNNDNSSSYGDIRYKHDTTVATNDPARIKFKMAGAIGEAERTPQGARITDPAQRWWWMSAELTGNYKATVNKADGTSQTGNIRTILEEDERYTASIVVNASEATLTDAYDNDTKLFVTPFGGTEQAFDLAKGDNTLSLQEFVFDGSDANLKFLFDELVADSELTVKSVTFTQVDDGWHKVKPNQDVTPSGSPWTLYADYQPDTDLSDGDQGLYGDMWYKVDGSGVSGTSIKPKLVAVGEPFYWNKATLKNYLSKTVAQGGAGLQDGHSYTGTISVSYTAGESEAGKTPKLRYIVEEAGTGEADKVLNSGSGTYTINLSEFMYHSDDANQDILFDLTGLEKDSIFKVNSITFTEVDADWTNVKGDTATPNPWTLTANYDGVEQWGHMRYKQTGTGVASVQIKPMATAMGNHYYWNNAVLEDYLSDVANLTDGVEYDAQIKVQYTAGEAEAGETPQLRYIMAAANTGEANFDFDEGSKTYTIDLPTFTYDASAGKDDIEFELDGLEKQSIFKVTEITFTPTGWTKVPNNTAFVPTGTPWTLTATNDQSTPGEEQWGNMSYKVDGTASNISSTLIKPNATAVGEHFYWNKAELKNYLATLQDGHSYTGSITFNYVSGKAVAGKTPELRTVIAAANTGEMDTAVTAGSNTIAISEFIYDSTAANKDVLFELDGLEEGSIFQVTAINFTEVDADWTNVKGGTATATPWILTANNNGTDQWGHLRYKQTGTGVSSVQVKPMNTSIGDHFYWNSAKLTDMTYGQTLTPGKEYSAVITVQYTAGEVESGKTPELLYNIPVAEVSEATKALNSGSGTYTINVPAFAYDSSADNSVEFELDSLEKKSVFKVTDITFTDTGWTKVTQNSNPDNPTTVNPSGTPWTLRADWIPDTDLSDGDQGMYGDMSYKVTGTASNVSATQLKINKSAVGEHFYWETATLKNYLNTLEDGCSYTGSITVNYTPGTAEAGKTPQLRTIIEGAYDGNIDTNLSSGTNTISIDEFIYSAADTRKDIMFELTGLEAGSIFQVSAINFTKQDSDWTNVKGGSDTATPWIITANNDGAEQWGHLRYKQTGTGVSSVQVKPMSVSMGDHFYWNSAKLTDMAYGQTLTAGNEYEAVITVQYTAGEAQSGKTPELLYNIPVAGISEETMALGSGSGTYTINVPAFTYDPNADNYAEFELDSLEKKSVFKVTDITFTSTGWKQVPKNTEFVPTGTPWTLEATNDQSTPGEEQWGDMSYKIDGTASDVNGTLIRPNATDVGEHYYWNTATLKDYMTTLEDGCSYTGSITVNYTPGTVVAGKTPELRTVIAAAGTGEKDTTVTSGSNTISIDEFIYNSSDDNQDILFELDGLEEGSVFQVSNITFTKLDADWTNVKGDEANPDPWTLTANYNGVDQWGHMRYKQTGTGVSSVEIKPINTAVGEHYYWNNAVLEDYLSDTANLTDGVEYDAQIKVQYTAGQAEAGKTPQLRYIMAAAETGEANFDFDEGSKTYTIDLPTFTYDASAGKDDIEFELDGLEKQSIFKVTSITFTPTGWTKVPNNTEFVPTGTPWTLKATNDQSTPGEEQWGNMSYKVTGTASNVSATQIRPNATDVGEHYYWNTATLKNYLATLEDGCSYTGSITVNYTPGEAVAGKDPEVRTVIEAANTGEKDTALTSGSNTISIDEFLYDSSATNKDILFELDGLEEGAIFQVTGITFTKQDADWTNVKGDEANPDPWTLTANYDGVTQWGHMRYKQTGTGVSSVEIKPINTAVGEHFYWNNAKLLDYLSDTANLEDGKEYEGTITVKYTAGQAEAGKTPQLRYIMAAANTGEANLDLDEGSKTYTIDLGKFIYDASAGNDDIEFELDGLEKQSIFQVTDITFEPTGWERIEQNDEVVPTDSQGNNTPWTLVATNDGQQQWGDMSVKVDGTASDVASTSIKLNTAAEGEHFYWNTATLKDYLATLEDGCSYTGSIVINYTSGEAEAGKTPELRTIIAGAFDGEKDTTLTNGTNTIAIDEFVYDAAKGEDDILFELTGLEKGSIFNVASITFTKQDADWINVKGDEVDADPWTITANNDGSTSWGHMRYKKTGTGVSSVQIKPINTAMGNHYYWNTASLEGYLANLVDGREYTATITLSYTAGEAEAGKTPQLRYIIEAANTGEANLNLNNGTGTYTIDIPKFTYEVEAGKNDIKFELDSLEKGSIFQVTDITFTPTGWDEVPISAAGFNPTGTPWTLKPINDGATTWGSMYYDIVGDPSDIGSTKMRVNNPGGEYDWNLAILEDYAKDNMEVGHSYTATIVYDYDDAPGKSGAAGDELKVAIDNNASIIDVGTTPTGSYTTDTFEYTGSDDDVTFFLDGLTKGSSLSISSVTFTNQDGDFENVPNDTDFTPTGTPWTLRAINNASTGQYGKLMYQVDGTPASNIGSTLINLKNTVGQQETDEHGDPVTPENRWWWTSASLMDYNANLEPWMTYTGSITLEITEATAPNAKLYVYVDGEEYGFPLTQGENTLEIPAFIFKGANNGGTNDVKFLLDELPTGANFRVTDITFTKDGNWLAVPDNRPDDNQFEITNVPFSYQFRNVDGTMGRTVSGTRDWQIFAGQWQGAGAVLYYDPDFTAAGQPKVRIGAGERWDPACAQIKLPNPTEAYKELEDYTSYYMTYEFTSTEMGTVHITHEGYEPRRPERIDITADMYDESDGLYHVKYQKKFTRCPDTDYDPVTGKICNLYLSLTATTYADGGAVVEDGTALPLGTVLSNFKVEYQRTDEEVYTLVNDCRFDGHQAYTPIVSNATLGKGVLLGYTNSNYGGWMSYQNGVYAAGEDAIAQASIRLDETNGDFGPETDWRWAEHLRIPNDYFYGNRDAGGDITEVGKDTNGNPLKTGNHYKLRFYYNVDLSEAEGSIGQGKGIVLVQQGFGEPHRYPSHSGLNMANGTINTKSGYNSHSDDTYAKDGGIDFVYDDTIRTIDPTEPGKEFLGHVQFDFSDLPSGAKITDISWEFYAPQYKVFIDDVEDGSVVEGETYTFPDDDPGVIKYYDEANDVYYEPGDTLTFSDFSEDIYVTAIRSYTAKVVDATDPTAVYAGPVEVQTGDKYTVPDVAGIESYTYNDQPVQPGDKIDVTGDIVVYATKAAGTHTVTIKNADGTETLETFTVEEGKKFTFPAASGDYEGVKDYIAVSGATGKQNPGDEISVPNDMVYKVEMLAEYTVTIDGTDVATVTEGDTYTFPAATGDYAGVDHFVDANDPTKTYDLEETVTPTGDISVKSVYTVTIVGTDEETVLDTFDVAKGDDFTFPTATGKYAHVQDFKGIEGSTETYNPAGTIDSVNNNMTFKVEMLPEYTISIDGVVVDTVYAGESYTFPTATGDYDGVLYFVNEDDHSDRRLPGTTITPEGNLSYKSIYTVTIKNTDGTTTLETTEVAKGDTFTFPDHIAQVDHIKDFVGINGTTGKYVPTDTITVDGNKEYRIERAFTVTIRNTDGTTKDVFTVDQGDDLTLPNATTEGYEDVKEFTDGTDTYPLGSTIEDVQEDIVLDVVPYTYYNVYIDGVQQQETVREGEGYTTPTDMPGVTKFIDTATQAEYNPGETVPNIQADLYLEAVSVPTYTWKVDGQPGGTVPAGTEITLPNTAAIGYLLAYTDGEDEGVTDDLYKPSAKYTVNRNVNFISINEVNMQQTDKVSMYYKQGDNQRGIRFLSKLTVNEESDTNILSSDAFQTGMLICAEDTYYEMLDEELTLEKAEEFEYVVNAQNNSDKTRKWITNLPGSFSCGIVDVKDYNIPRNFLSRGYVIVNYVGGDSQVIYSDPSTPRSVKWIANQVFNDKTAYNKLDDWKKAIVDYCKDFEEE